eukprot:6264710-Ditylum_brightwellii.AAC.1
MLLQWRSNPVNHQNGVALLLSARRATNNTPVNEIGNKVNEKEKHFKVATFPNNAKKSKNYYSTMLRIGGTEMFHYCYM